MTDNWKWQCGRQNWKYISGTDIYDGNSKSKFVTMLSVKKLSLGDCDNDQQLPILPFPAVHCCSLLQSLGCTFIEFVIVEMPDLTLEYQQYLS